MFYNKSSVTCLNNIRFAKCDFSPIHASLVSSTAVLELEYEYEDDNGAKCDVNFNHYRTYEYDFIINKSIYTDTEYHLTVKRMEEPLNHYATVTPYGYYPGF